MPEGKNIFDGKYKNWHIFSIWYSISCDQWGKIIITTLPTHFYYLAGSRLLKEDDDSKESIKKVGSGKSALNA